MKVKTIYNEIPTMPSSITITGVDWKVNLQPDLSGASIVNDINSSEHRIKTFEHSFTNGEPVFAEVITHLSTGDSISSGVIPIYEDTISKGNAPVSYAPEITITYTGMNTTIHFVSPKFMDNNVIFDRIQLTLCDLGHRPFYEHSLNKSQTTFVLTPSDYKTSAFIAEITYVTSDGIKSQTGRILITPEINKTGNDPRLETYNVQHDRTTLTRAVNTNALHDGAGGFMFNGCALIPDNDYSKTITLQGDTEEKVYALNHQGTQTTFGGSYNPVAQTRISFRMNGVLYQSTGNATFTANGTTYHATLPDSAFAYANLIQVNENTVVLCKTTGFDTFLIEVSGTTINFIQIMSFDDNTNITNYAHTVVNGKIYIGDKHVDIYTGDYTVVDWYDGLVVEFVEAPLNGTSYTTVNVNTGATHTYSTTNPIKSLHYTGTHVIVYTSSTEAYLVDNTSNVTQLTLSSGVTCQAKSTTHQYIC